MDDLIARGAWNRAAFEDLVRRASVFVEDVPDLLSAFASEADESWLPLRDAPPAPRDGDG